MKILIFFFCSILLIAQPGAPVGGYGGAMVSSATNPTGTACVTATAVALLYQSTVYTCQAGTYQPFSSGGGTGNAGATVSVTSAATVNYPCPSSLAGTNVTFLVSALAASITSSTQNTAVCNAGTYITFRFLQNGTGNFTVAMPTGYEACFIATFPNTGTKCLFYWDGSNARLISNTNDGGFSEGQTVVAPGTPPAGDYVSYYDSTSNLYTVKINNSATVHTMVPVTNSGASRTVASMSELFYCTAICTVTPLVPVVGMQLCVQNDDNIATTITLAAIVGVQYETTARTSYKAANTSIVSTGAIKDQICIVGRDATHYNVWSFTGTWN